MRRFSEQEDVAKAFQFVKNVSFLLRVSFIGFDSNKFGLGHFRENALFGLYWAVFWSLSEKQAIPCACASNKFLQGLQLSLRIMFQ